MPDAKTMQVGEPIAFVVSLNEAVDDLSKTMKVFSDFGLSFSHLETRQSKNGADTARMLEAFIQTSLPTTKLDEVVQRLRTVVQAVSIHPIERGVLKRADINVTKETTADICHVPWFPRHISELDNISNNVYLYGTDLDADHPGFKDEEYRKRRQFYTELAYSYKYGQPLPKIEYTEVEKATWCCVYRKLLELYETYACREHLENLKLLQEHAGYQESTLPQLEDISKFLQSRTGFTLRPVAGYLSARDFLAALAFRVFCCTQYIRHHEDPMYTPEPDCCHELLGHMPMLADQSFADFSHEIGLASLGTSDEEVKKLATCYFFTIEFGLCRENGQLRAYGAGLLSSAAELQFALSDKAYVRPFVPNEVIKEECIVTTFQNGYFETRSFDEATRKMRNFTKTLERPFDVVYNPYTQRIEVIDTIENVTGEVKKLTDRVNFVNRSLLKVGQIYSGSVRRTWVMDSLRPHEHLK